MFCKISFQPYGLLSITYLINSQLQDESKLPHAQIHLEAKSDLLHFCLIDKRITKSEVSLALQSAFVMLTAKGNMLVLNGDLTWETANIKNMDVCVTIYEIIYLKSFVPCGS